MKLNSLQEVLEQNEKLIKNLQFYDKALTVAMTTLRVLKNQNVVGIDECLIKIHMLKKQLLK